MSSQAPAVSRAVTSTPNARGERPRRANASRRLPTFPARWVLEDPRRRSYLVFWDRGGDVYALKMAPSEGGNAVLVTLESGETYQIDVLRRPLPRGSGMDVLYVCPRCRRPRRYLYLLTRSGDKLVDHLGLRCQVCAGLRFASQGHYPNKFERGFLKACSQEASRRLGCDVVVGRTFPSVFRLPWDPRAVSDPGLVAEEFSPESKAPPVAAPGAGPDDVGHDAERSRQHHPHRADTAGNH